MILEVCWGGWPLDHSLGLSQFHGHGSWFVCEVALKWLVFLIACPYLLGMWFGEDQSANLNSEHDWEELCKKLTNMYFQ